MAEAKNEEVLGRTKPTKLFEVCTILDQNEGSSPEEIAEESNLSKREAQATIVYGSNLGFIKETFTGATTSERGNAFAIEGEFNQSTEELFKEGIKKYDLYSKIIDIYMNAVEKSEMEKNGIQQKEISNLLQTQFGFREMKQKPLQRASNTFLQTLEKAGCGQFEVSRYGKPTRLDINDEDIKLLNEIAKSGSRPNEQPIQKDTRPEQMDIDIPSESISEIRNKLGKTKGEGHERDSEIIDQNKWKTNINININLEITGEEDPEHVAELLSKIRDALDDRY